MTTDRIYIFVKFPAPKGFASGLVCSDLQFWSLFRRKSQLSSCCDSRNQRLYKTRQMEVWCKKYKIAISNQRGPCIFRVYVSFASSLYEEWHFVNLFIHYLHEYWWNSILPNKLWTPFYWKSRIDWKRNVSVKCPTNFRVALSIE